MNAKVNLNGLAVTLLIIFQAVFAAVATVTPETLGLSPKVVAWLAIANVGVGVLLNQLAPVGRKKER